MVYANITRIISVVAIIIGLVVMIGWFTDDAIDSPPLYYQVDGTSGAMALHTAIAFTLLGISLILLAKPEFIEREISVKYLK